MQIHKITSKQNAIFKDLKKLSTSKHRRLKERFLVEGLRESELALKSKFVSVETLLFSPEILSKSDFDLNKCIKENSSLKFIELTVDLYNELAVRENTEGILLLASQKEIINPFEPKNLVRNEVYFAFDGVEKPGNIGAFLRTADALGVKAVFILAESYDVFNPNTIRSSLGTVFTVPVYVVSYEAFMNIFSNERAEIVLAKIEKDAKDISDYVFGSKACVVVMGSEANGVSQYWDAYPHIQSRMIPMVGHVNSMNVSVAAAIFAYSLCLAKNQNKKVSLV